MRDGARSLLRQDVAVIGEQVTVLHRREGIRLGEREQGAAKRRHEYPGAALPWD